MHSIYENHQPPLSLLDLREAYLPYGIRISFNSFGDYIIHHPAGDPMDAIICRNLGEAAAQAELMAAAWLECIVEALEPDEPIDPRAFPDAGTYLM